MAEKLSSPRPKQLPVVPVPTGKKLISPAPTNVAAQNLTGPKLSMPQRRPPPAPPAKAIVPVSTRRVSVITDVSNTIWRDELLPAHFDNCQFHVETGAREGGRRIVVHEFPKKDLPYSEDMGRSATTFTVRGYCIVYPRNTPNEPLYSRDYRLARNILQERLDLGGAGTLQLPTYRPVRCVCQRYRMTEEQKLGGYVVFDMQFVEVGAPPFRPVEDTEANMIEQSKQLKQQVLLNLQRPHVPRSNAPRPVLPTGPQTGRPFGPISPP
jgi:DNA circularisation protein N-terminus